MSLVFSWYRHAGNIVPRLGRPASCDATFVRRWSAWGSSCLDPYSRTQKCRRWPSPVDGGPLAQVQGTESRSARGHVRTVGYAAVDGWLFVTSEAEWSSCLLAS